VLKKGLDYTMQIAGIVEDSIVDGPGLRFVVFTQGCKFECKGCHNPETWDMLGGDCVEVTSLIEQMRSNPLTDGLTLSGGEPFEQADECAKLAAEAQSDGLDVWVFTGFLFEELYRRSQMETAVSKFLKQIDVLVDGLYIEAERTLSLKWCQSKNQRVIDVKKSMTEGRACYYEEAIYVGC